MLTFIVSNIQRFSVDFMNDRSAIESLEYFIKVKHDVNLHYSLSHCYKQ